MVYAYSHLFAFLITILLLVGLRPLAFHFNLIDRPGGRKTHHGNIPLIGGIAMFGGFIAFSLVHHNEVMNLLPMLTGLSIVLFIGLLDDVHDLSTKVRFFAQITAALVMIYGGGIVLNDLGHLINSETLVLGSITVPFTVFCVVGVTNAMNISDGMDGLGGGLALVALLAMISLVLNTGRVEILSILLALATTVTAFMAFNMRTPWRSHAKVFMGSAGSMSLGFILAWFMVNLSQGEQRVMEPVTAIWIFALPLLDTVSVMLRRILKGRSPFAPDREHFHHILLVAGYSVNQSVFIMLTIALVLAIVGVAGHYTHVPEAILFYAFLGLSAVYFWSMHHAWKVMKSIRLEKQNSSPNQRKAA